jgi:hypothetical protein
MSPIDQLRLRFARMQQQQQQQGNYPSSPAPAAAPAKSATPTHSTPQSSSSSSSASKRRSSDKSTPGSKSTPRGGKQSSTSRSSSQQSTHHHQQHQQHQQQQHQHYSYEEHDREFEELEQESQEPNLLELDMDLASGAEALMHKVKQYSRQYEDTIRRLRTELHVTKANASAMLSQLSTQLQIEVDANAKFRQLLDDQETVIKQLRNRLSEYEYEYGSGGARLNTSSQNKSQATERRDMPTQTVEMIDPTGASSSSSSHSARAGDDLHHASEQAQLHEDDELAHPYEDVSRHYTDQDDDIREDDLHRDQYDDRHHPGNYDDSYGGDDSLSGVEDELEWIARRLQQDPSIHRGESSGGPSHRNQVVVEGEDLADLSAMSNDNSPVRVWFDQGQVYVASNYEHMMEQEGMSPEQDPESSDRPAHHDGRDHNAQLAEPQDLE